VKEPREPREPRTTLYRGPSLAVIDVACRAHHRPLGTEEASDTHTVVFVRTGAFVRDVEGQSRCADPTRILFFTRGQPYRVAHPFEGGDRCTVLEASTETLIEIGGRHLPAFADRPDAPFPRLHAASTPRSMLLHYALVVGLRRRALDVIAIQELALELLDEALGAARPGPSPARRCSVAESRAHRDLAEAAKAMLLTRYQSPPSLDELARTLGCSPFHLSRTFSRVAGVPLRRHLDRLRLRLALERLARGAADLTDLALDLGYADHSHFTNAFRREFGAPPSAFRRR
jgi:AraC family transcriptional regulator